MRLNAANGLPASSRRNAAAFNDTDGTVTNWTPSPIGVAGITYTIAASGSSVFVGGSFSNSNGVPQGGFAHYETCGTSAVALPGACADEPETIEVAVDAGLLALGTALPGDDAFNTSTITVTTNAFFGYTLTAADSSATHALACTGGGCGAATIADWTGTDASPTVWTNPFPAPSTGAGGITVRDAPGGRDTKWGPNDVVYDEDDIDDNKYAGLSTTPLTLHTTDRYTTNSGQDTLMTYRMQPATDQLAGSYEAEITITALANP